MTQQSMPNPAELYEAAVAQTRKFVAGVKSDQLGAQTPCGEWNVQKLLEHINDATNYLTGFMGGSKPDIAAGQSALATYDAITQAALASVKAAGAMEKKGPGPMGGEMTGAQFTGLIFGDNLIHGWDVAKATGQDTAMDPKLVDACASMLEPTIEGGRSRGAFGPAVQPPPNASAQDKFLGMTGRKA